MPPAPVARPGHRGQGHVLPAAVRCHGGGGDDGRTIHLPARVGWMAGLFIWMLAGVAGAGEAPVVVEDGRAVVIERAARAGRVELRDGRVTLEGAAVDANAVVWMAARRDPPWPPSPDAVETRTGERWRGRAVRANGTRLWFEVDGAGERLLRIDALSALVMASADAGADTDASLSTPERPHVLWRRDGTSVPGKFLAMDAERVTMSTAAGTVRIPRDTVARVVFSLPSTEADGASKTASTPGDASPLDELVLRDGQVWQGRVAFEGDGFALHRMDDGTGEGAVWRVPWLETVRMRRGARTRPATFSDYTARTVRNEPMPDDAPSANAGGPAPMTEEERATLPVGGGFRWRTGESAAMAGGDGFRMFRTCLASLPGQRGTAVVRVDVPGRPAMTWKVGPGDAPRWVVCEVPSTARVSVSFDRAPTFPCGVLMGDPYWFAP